MASEACDIIYAFRHLPTPHINPVSPLPVAFNIFPADAPFQTPVARRQPSHIVFEQPVLSHLPPRGSRHVLILFVIVATHYLPVLPFCHCLFERPTRLDVLRAMLPSSSSLRACTVLRLSCHSFDTLSVLVSRRAVGISGNWFTLSVLARLPSNIVYCIFLLVRYSATTRLPAYRTGPSQSFACYPTTMLYRLGVIICHHNAYHTLAYIIYCGIHSVSFVESILLFRYR